MSYGQSTSTNCQTKINTRLVVAYPSLVNLHNQSRQKGHKQNPIRKIGKILLLSKQKLFSKTSNTCSSSVSHAYKYMYVAFMIRNKFCGFRLFVIDCISHLLCRITHSVTLLGCGSVAATRIPNRFRSTVTKLNIYIRYAAAKRRRGPWSIRIKTIP